MDKGKRMTRTIRVDEHTAQLIEAILRRDRGKKFADIVGAWADVLYPKSHRIASENFERLDDVLDTEYGEEDE